MADSNQTLTPKRETAFDRMTRQELLRALEMFARNWLAHDGCWFLAAEESIGMETAMELDSLAWQRFAVAEASRIMSTFNIAAGGGLRALQQALSLRQYALLNQQRFEWTSDGNHLRFFMDTCHVQEARRRKGLADFPCKNVGRVEFETFARAVDPRIHTRCLHCPPDPIENRYCGWEFSLVPANLR